MSDQDPEWTNKAQVHNALAILNLSRVVQPPVLFGILYWALGATTDLSKIAIIGIAFIIALGDYLALTLLVKQLKNKSNKIG